MRSVWFFCLLFANSAVNAETWDLVGESSVGKHYVDHATVVKDLARQTFTIQTKVEEARDSIWVTTMQVDCKAHRFSYLKGYQIKAGKQVVNFDAPRAEEAISPESLPDQLQQQYCAVAAIPAAQSPQWEVISNSNTGEVAFDRASLRQAAGEFTVNARVIPFNKSGQTLSTVQLHCEQGTFKLLQASKLQDDKSVALFDKPQPVAPVSKSPTVQQLAKVICSPSAKPSRNPFQEDACKATLHDLQALEGRVQADVDAHALYCDTMQKYLDQLAGIADAVEKSHCDIHGLDEYQRQIRSSGCEGAPRE